MKNVTENGDNVDTTVDNVKVLVSIGIILISLGRNALIVILLAGLGCSFTGHTGDGYKTSHNMQTPLYRGDRHNLVRMIFWNSVQFRAKRPRVSLGSIHE